MDALKKKKAADAEKNFEKAVEIYPKYAAAWHELGRYRAGQRRRRHGSRIFEQAVKADPEFVNRRTWNSPLIDWKAEKWQQVADIDREGRANSILSITRRPIS